MNRKITSILMSFSLIFSIVPFYNVSAIVDDSNNLDDYALLLNKKYQVITEITTENGNVISLKQWNKICQILQMIWMKDLFVQP